MARPKNIKLYENIKKKLFEKMPKNSAYRSGLLVKKYKEEYKKKTGKDDAYYTNKKKNEGLTRWFAEDWRNQRGEIGYKKKGDIYRPTKRITKDTPKTYKELSKKDIMEAMKEKKKTGRVSEF